MKIALAMIVKGSDAEAAVLDRALASISPYVDGIFITRTHKAGEVPNAAVAKVAKRYKAKLSDFEWVYDFSKARNFNFSQVPKEYDYIMWSDADDVWRGLAQLKPTLEKHPHMDAFGFWYLYDWDEWKTPTVVHQKTMIIKNDGAAEWVGSIHEDLTPLRTLEIQLIQGIERLHLTNGDRIKEAAARNLDIAGRELKAKPDDPRSFWNLANARFAAADYKGAAEAFEEFLDKTNSNEEKYLAYCRIADIFRAMGEMGSSERHLQTAIGLMPTVPDAYLQLGHLYFQMSNWDKAEEYILMGIVKRPVTSKMIVFNPRDYDYNPLMLLAKVYYYKNRPHNMLTCLEGCLRIYPKSEELKRMVKEAKVEKREMAKALHAVQRLQRLRSKERLKKEIEALPVGIRSHPVISAMYNQNFVKAESSGKDLVIYCGQTVHEWNPELFKKKGFGGSEEAVVNLAREWAKLGWNVTVYNSCGHKVLREQIQGPDGDIKVVTYKPYWEWNYRDKQDVVILWRWTKPLDADINAPKIFVDLHDVMPAGEFTEKRLAKVTKVMVKTQFHRSLFPNVPDDKIVVIPNGMDFATLVSNPPIKKDPYLVINTSSPDRSMDVLPELFAEVKKLVPQAKMKWAYGWELFKVTHANDKKKMEWMNERIKKMEEVGIESLGKIPQSEVGKLYQEATILAYPTEFAEIDCISVKKAQAAECVPVTTNFGALEESVRFGVKVNSKKTKETWNRPYQYHFGLEDKGEQLLWVSYVVQLLTQGMSIDWTGLDKWKARYTWQKIAKGWNDLMA